MAAHKTAPRVEAVWQRVPRGRETDRGTQRISVRLLPGSAERSRAPPHDEGGNPSTPALTTPPQGPRGAERQNGRRGASQPASARQAERQERGEDAVALRVEGVVAIWHGVGRGGDVRCLPEGLREQLPVGARCRPVAVAKDGEKLHRRGCRGPLPQGCHLLRQEGGERHDRAEENHASHMSGDDLEHGRVHGKSSTLAEAKDDDVLPIQLSGSKLDLDGLDHGTAKQFNIVQHVKVLVLKVRPVAHEPTAVCHLNTVQVEIHQTLACGVLGPGDGQEGSTPDGGRQVLEDSILCWRLVANPNDEGARVLGTRLQCDRQRTLRGRGCDTLGCEEKVQPLRLQLVPLILLLLL
mmetsp:Transcript_21237/g.48513  ORF Transcript_21237/g.48513 Transcript_21237/m.48513 type:complete len:352 (-) Transcript_21237:1749-2804(-)